MIIVAVSCGKDKFNTKPSLKLKSINSRVIPVNGVLNIEFEFTDKEGDISNLLTLKKKTSLFTRLAKEMLLRPTRKNTWCKFILVMQHIR